VVVELAKVNSRLEVAAEGQEELRRQVEKLSSSFLRGDLEVGTRIDELMARSIKSRDEYDELRDRLQEAEAAIAQGPAPMVTVERAPAAPSWASELAGLQNVNAGKRWNAVQALGDSGDPAVVPHLIPVITDSDTFVRMAVCRVFGDLGSPVAVDALITTLQDEEGAVREAAMVSLHAITGRNFHFDPEASTAEREKKVKAWSKWWAKAKEEYSREA
jgi:HEAT repeat protein